MVLMFGVSLGSFRMGGADLDLCAPIIFELISLLSSFDLPHPWWLSYFPSPHGVLFLSDTDEGRGQREARFVFSRISPHWCQKGSAHLVFLFFFLFFVDIFCPSGDWQRARCYCGAKRW